VEVEAFQVAVATTGDPRVVLRKLTSLCKVLEHRLQRPASGQLMVSYEHLELTANADAFDLMWLPPLVAARLVPSGAAHILAVPVRGGQSSYATALFTRPDGDTASLDDLAGKTAAWVGKRSAAGYMLPRAFLHARGIVPDEIFSEQRLLGTHDKVVASVLDGGADVGATWVHLKDGAITSAGWGERDVRVLASHGPIPADILACGRTLTESARARMRAFVLDQDSDVSTACRDLMECDAFATADDAHLDALSLASDEGPTA
jgi:phosphonate transport system substrate-binding protein